MQKSYGQEKGYLIQGDSVYSEGFIQFDLRKPSEVKFGRYRRGGMTTYMPKEASAFGYQDSTIYVAKTVSLEGKSQTLFMQMLGDSVFYYLQHKRLFFTDNDTLQQLHKNNLLPYLQTKVYPSDKWYKELHLFRLKAGQLRYFANNRNASISPTVMFLGAGIFSGFNNSIFTSKYLPYLGSSLDEFRMTSFNTSIGVFADVPIWSFVNFSVYTPLTYGVMRFNESVVLESPGKGNIKYDVKLNLDFIRFALMPRYTLSYAKLRVFAFAGPSCMYFLKSESRMIETLQETNDIWITYKAGLSVNEPYRLGYEAGAGIGFFLLPRHLLSVSLSQGRNYSKYFDISNRSVTISMNL